MLKKCKWCKKEQEMKGKQEFCPGRKCKNARIYANKTGKLDNKKKNEAEKDIPDDTSKFPTLLGQLVRTSSTADKCLRLSIDIPTERVNLNVTKHLFCGVVVAFIEENETETEKKDYKKADKDDKDHFFN
jgi:hypothetical protein